jgi:sulfiredoxin
MMKRATLAIADIYVPVKRRATLEQKRVDEIAASILDKGLLTPILVRADGARFVLVEGLHHLGAPKALGEETIVGFRAEALAHDLIRYGDLQQACSHLLCATAPAGSRRSSYFLRKLSRAPLAECRQLALVGISKCARSM